MTLKRAAENLYHAEHASHELFDQPDQLEGTNIICLYDGRYAANSAKHIQGDRCFPVPPAFLRQLFKPEAIPLNDSIPLCGC